MVTILPTLTWEYAALTIMGLIAEKIYIGLGSVFLEPHLRPVYRRFF